MIDMGFYNERDFWLEDDETEYHVRAYYKHKWITGYFPAGHTYVHRNRFNTIGIYIHADNRLHLVAKSIARQDKRAHNLVRSHPDIEGKNMQDTFLSSLILEMYTIHKYNDL